MNFREEVIISLPLKETFYETVHNTLMENKGEKVKFSKDQENMLPHSHMLQDQIQKIHEQQSKECD